MTFDVAADAYGRFMGRFSEPLADLFADFAQVRPGQRGLDVGCGPGAMTARLVDRLGASEVAAVDPSEPFVAAAKDRLPGVDVRHGVAEDLPFADGTFDVVTCQLVVHFLKDPVAGVQEMGRVAADGGTVALAAWRREGNGVGPLTPFWLAVTACGLPGREVDLVGTGEGELADLCSAAGLTPHGATVLSVTSRFETFDQWWQPFTLGVGPAGQFVAGLDHVVRERVRTACQAQLGTGPFEVTGNAWALRAHP